MKQTIKWVSICAVIFLTFFILTGCKDIFHSKEDIDYMDLVVNRIYGGSVKEGDRNYYKFYAEQGVTYYINWHVSNYSTYDKNTLKVATFWYDTGGTLTGERIDWRTWSSGPSGPSFTAVRSGDVVIRITAESKGSLDTADYEFIVSTKKEFPF